MEKVVGPKIHCSPDLTKEYRSLHIPTKKKGEPYEKNRSSSGLIQGESFYI